MVETPQASTFTMTSYCVSYLMDLAIQTIHLISVLSQVTYLSSTLIYSRRIRLRAPTVSSKYQMKHLKAYSPSSIRTTGNWMIIHRQVTTRSLLTYLSTFLKSTSIKNKWELIIHKET